MPRRRNPFPNLSTGSAAIDAMAVSAAQGLAGRLIGALDPSVQTLARSAWQAVAPGNVPAIANPSKGGDVGRFVSDLAAVQGGLFVTLGKRGSGKTAFDLKLAQVYHRQGRPVFVIGMPQRVLTRFGFKEIAPGQLDSLPNNAVAVLDDVALFYSNRDYAKAGLLHKLIIESRHRHIVIIVNAHNSALVDKYLFEATVLFLKPSSSLTADLQRGGIAKLVEKANAAFEQVPREERKRYTYAYSDELEYEGMIVTTPPDGWNQAVSEHHGG